MDTDSFEVFLRRACATKSRIAAMEYAAEGVRVDALVAGAFDTPMLKKAIEQAAGGDAERHRAMEQQFLSLVPLRRITLVSCKKLPITQLGSPTLPT